MKELSGRIIISTCGRTAVGKTTIARFLADALSISYISEGEIKRSFVQTYTWQDSLDEGLRDKGYQEAIARATNYARNSLPCIVDASFHKSNRRAWLFENIKSLDGISIVLYCECHSVEVIKKRILKRKFAKKCADTQADSFNVYAFVDKEFDQFSMNEIPHGMPFLLFHINTEFNKVVNIHAINEDKKVSDVGHVIHSLINRYLFNMEWDNDCNI